MTSPKDIEAIEANLLRDLKNLVTAARKLAEDNPVAAVNKNASSVTILITAWILLAKNMGMSRAQIHEALDNVWDNLS